MTHDPATSEARQMLYDLLMSPYTNLSAWAITRACVYLEHPMRPPLPGRQPTSCICGKVKGAA